MESSSVDPLVVSLVGLDGAGAGAGACTEKEKAEEEEEEEGRLLLWLGSRISVTPLLLWLLWLPVDAPPFDNDASPCPLGTARSDTLISVA